MISFSEKDMLARWARTCCVTRACLLFLFNLNAVAQAQDFTYTTNNGSITITSYIGPGGAATSPGTINSLPVTCIVGFKVFGNSVSVTSVTIPGSVTNIGSQAFVGCSSLTNLVILDSPASIGQWAFGQCTSLRSVTLGNRVTSIGAVAFAWCANLRSSTRRGSTSPKKAPRLPPQPRLGFACLA